MTGGEARGPDDPDARGEKPDEEGPDPADSPSFGLSERPEDPCDDLLNAEGAAGESGLESAGRSAGGAADPPPEERGSATSDVHRRWWLTNDVIAGVSVASFVAVVALHGYGLLDVSTLPNEVTYAWIGIVIAAATWVFGVDLVEKWGAE